MFNRKKKKTGCETPELRKYTPPPMSPVKPPKPPTSGSNAVKPGCGCGHQPTYTSTQNPPNVFSTVTKPAKQKENKTMYGLNLYIPFEDLDAYIHEHIDNNYGDCHFIPVKVGINEVDLSIEIKLLSASSTEIDNCRYKIDLNKMEKEKTL
jgi:hypothetical protein